MDYLTIRNVSKRFGEGAGAFEALADINLEVGRREFVSLIGHSGCGKSTLLNLVSGLHEATSGTISLYGKPVEGPGRDRSMVFQHHGLLPWMTVRDNVYHAVDAAFETSMLPKEKAAHSEEFLRMVGLWEHRTKKPSEISGGMKQRVAIARAFAVHPKVLLLDEPFGALDALTKGTMHDELLRLWAEEEKTETVLMVTHDIEEAIYLSDRIAVLTNGPRATIGEIVEVPLSRPRDKASLPHDPVYLEIHDRLIYLLTQKYALAA